MKYAMALLALAGTVTACGPRAMMPLSPLTGIPTQAMATAKAPIALKVGLKLTYNVTGKMGGTTQKAYHEQVITALTASSATITHTIPDQYGKPYTFNETVQHTPALVSSRWTSQALLTTDLDPSIGQPETITVKAGTFKTKKVVAAAHGTSETWWFAGNVPVKVAFKGLNLGKIDVTAELASY